MTPPVGTIVHGDCIEVMATWPDESIDSVCCDPPYGLEFMGKEWDRLGDIGKTSHAGPSDRDGSTVFGRQRVAYSGSSNRKCGVCRKWEWDYPDRKCVCDAPEFPNVRAHQSRLMQDWHYRWAVEAFRVAKPGAHLLAFGGTRTYHRLASAIEDAGWEIRDTLVWAYASGFPKSLDVSKAIDKARDDRADVEAVRLWLDARRREAGRTLGEINVAMGLASNGGGLASSWTTNQTTRAVPRWDQWLALKALLGFGDEMDAEVWRLNGRKGTPGEAWRDRDVVGEQAVTRMMAGSGDLVGGTVRAGVVPVTAPATDAAREWQGWGTALKPAWEPIVLARKPLRGTVAANVQAYGTGALNIDGCRIAGDVPTTTHGRSDGDHIGQLRGRPLSEFEPNAAGRWPANVILTDPIFDGDTPGVVGGGETGPSTAPGFAGTGTTEDWRTHGHDRRALPGFGDSGTYSRFFELPRGEGCYLCGRARPVVETSSQPSPSDASAPSPVATPPDGAQASMALEEDPDTENDTSETATSTSPELPPVIVSPLRQPAKTAAQPPTSTGITTTIPDRWMCGPCADAVMHESTPPQPKPTRPELPVDGDDYTRFLIVPKSSRSDREPVLGGQIALRSPAFGNPTGDGLGRGISNTRQDIGRANVHPTVKPTELMRHLVRLVTPPGGLVLDPFMGSGTTALACEMEGFRWVGIEREAEYVAIAEARLNGTQRGLGLVG